MIYIKNIFLAVFALSLISSLMILKSIPKLPNDLEQQTNQPIHVVQVKNLVRTPKEEQAMFQAKSAPTVLPGGSVVMPHKGQPWFIYQGKECMGPICSKPEQKQDVIQIEGDVIVVSVSHHYFHFLYETMLTMWPLVIHGVLEKYPNATILFYPSKPSALNIEMMKALKFDLPMNKVMTGVEKTEYKVDDQSAMIGTRHNDYHNKAEFQPYNFWLLRSMRETLDIPESPQDEIFISRKGYRRGIEREDDLFAALLPSFPNLRSILPDDFSVAEQAVLFSNAKLIISPHGASLTNVVFSNWDKVVLIEFSPERSEFFATFRNDLQVKRHYLMKCQSVPCKTKNKQKNCDVWEQQIDVDVAHSTEVIKSIMSGAHADREDFVIRRHGHSGAASY